MQAGSKNVSNFKNCGGRLKEKQFFQGPPAMLSDTEKLARLLVVFSSTLELKPALLGCADHDF